MPVDDGGVTTAVNITDCNAVAGLGDALTEVLVTTGLTVMDIMPVLFACDKLPPYSAVIITSATGKGNA